MKIGIFGGTFNPIHYGHLRAAEEVRTMFGLERIFFIPSGNPPLKRKDLAEAKHRYKMVRMAVRGNPYFEVLDIECNRPGKSYTVNTLELLLKKYTDVDFYFMVGIDAFLDIPNWREPEKIMSLTNFIVLSRPGNNFEDLLGSPYLDIKKTGLGRSGQRRKRSLQDCSSKQQKSVPRKGNAYRDFLNRHQKVCQKRLQHKIPVARER